MMQPLQALSVQSFHNDSPPFIGTNEGGLEYREVPHLDLGTIPERPSSTSSSQESSVVPEKVGSLHEPTPVMATIRLPVEQGLSRSRIQLSRPASAFAASVPGSPEEREFDNSLPNGDYETDAERDPPRFGTPIKLEVEASSYHFPRHRLNTQMAGEPAPQLT
jgi:hypothetical protein